MKILICGAGIAGLTLAGFLRKNGVSPMIIEKAPQTRNKGYAIVVWDKGWKVLQHLGVGKELARQSIPIKQQDIFDTTGKLLKTLDFGKHFYKYHPTMMVKRTDLHNALEGSVDQSCCHFGLTIRHMEELENTVQITFSNGKTEKFDLVVGADGANSYVRNLIFPQENNSQQYGWKVFLFWTKPNFTKSGTVVNILGDKTVFLYMPLAEKGMAFFGIVDSGADTQNVANFLQEKFANFQGIVPDILTTIPASADIFSACLQKTTLRTVHTQRIVLIGDAAHTLSPLLGMGTSLAMEDAAVLAMMLADASQKNISEILQKYGQQRKKTIDAVLQEERRLWKIINVRSPLQNFIRNMALRLAPEFYLTSGIQKILAQSEIKQFADLHEKR